MDPQYAALSLCNFEACFDCFENPCAIRSSSCSIRSIRLAVLHVAAMYDLWLFPPLALILLIVVSLASSH